jgi:hypothetical protein
LQPSYSAPAPRPSYGAPASSGYSAPAPRPSYGAPASSGYSAPASSGYSAPAPRPSYSAPASSGYSAPSAPSYAPAPHSSYSAPAAPSYQVNVWKMSMLTPICSSSVTRFSLLTLPLHLALATAHLLLHLTALHHNQATPQLHALATQLQAHPAIR